MATPKGEEIKIRVPLSMKAQVQALADARLSSESAIVREALLEYLQRHGVLRDAPAAAAPAVERSVNYRKTKPSSSTASPAGKTDKVAAIVRKHGPSPKPSQ